MKYSPLLSGSAALLITLAASACGSSRQLQSVTLSPATADARNFPNGQVSFTATGTYNKAPSPVQLTGNQVFWCVGTASGTCAGNIAIEVLVDQNGVAQCDSGFVGTQTILAGTQPTSVNPDTGSQLKVFGSAQLTCP